MIEAMERERPWGFGLGYLWCAYPGFDIQKKIRDVRIYVFVCATEKVNVRTVTPG